MELLENRGVPIVSTSVSSVTSTSFVSLNSRGAITLWDTRLKRKAYAHLDSSICEHNDVAGEVLFLANRNTVVTACEELLELFDIRKLSAGVETYQHDCEVVQFLCGSLQPSDRNALFADGNGSIVPFDFTSLRPISTVPSFAFGEAKDLDGDCFGQLSNYCCALESVKSIDGKMVGLLTLGMDGEGLVFSSPEISTKFMLSSGISSNGNLVNPPLPTCCRALNNLIAVGRADGTYTVASVSNITDVEEELSASSHPTSGVCAVEWIGLPGQEMLVTVSLCGDVSAWGVKDFMEIPEEDYNEEDFPSEGGGLGNNFYELVVTYDHSQMVSNGRERPKRLKYCTALQRALCNVAYAIGTASLFNTVSSRDEIFLVSGERYTGSDSKKFIHSFLQRLMYFSYRSSLVPLPNGDTSDAGWGCLIRAAQMLMGVALLRCASRTGLLPSTEDNFQISSSSFQCVESLFMDDPSAPFSIHKLQEETYKAGVPYGSFVGPTPVAEALSNAFCGYKSISNNYQDALFQLFKNDTFCGILLGEHQAAYYAFGCQGRNFFCLDPHYVQDAYVSWSSRGRHQGKCRTVKAKNVECSLVVAFYLHQIENYRTLCGFLQSVNSQLPLPLIPVLP